MHVVAHDAIVVQLKVETLLVAGEQVAKCLEVLVVVKDGFSVMTAGHDMVRGIVGKLHPAWFSWHGAFLAISQCVARTYR
jgi:hypothetical protein